MKLAYPLLALLFLSVFMLPTAKAGTVTQPTRYLDVYYPFLMNNFQFLLLAPALDTWSLGYDYFESTSTLTGSRTASWYMQVYLINWDSTNITQLTSTNYLLFYRNTNGEGIQNKTWNCPLFSIKRNDTVYIIIKYGFSSGPGATEYLVSSIWGVGPSEWGMETQGAIKLVNSTWTISLYTYRYYSGSGKTYGRLYFNNATYASCVDNMQFDDGVTEATEMESEFPVGLGAGAILMGFVAVIAFSIKKRR